MIGCNPAVAASMVTLVARARRSDLNSWFRTSTATKLTLAAYNCSANALHESFT